MSFSEKILKFIFKSHYQKKDRYESFIKKFPCTTCRPEFEPKCGSFCSGILNNCVSCGRSTYL